MAPNWKAFAECILERWAEGDTEIDMFDVQGWAEKYGVLVPIEGGFDPETHVDLTGAAEPGDPFFQVAS